MRNHGKMPLILAGAAVLLLPGLGTMLSGPKREWFILFYEQLCSGTIITALVADFLRRQPLVDRAPMLLLLGACAMAVGDLCTSLTEILGLGQRSIPVSVGLPSYLAFALITCVAVRGRYWPKFTKISAAISVFSLAALAALQFSYLLSPLRASSELFALVKTSYILYRLAECANIVLLVPIVIRVEDYVEHAFLQGLLLVHMAGFAISYHNAHGSGQPHAWPAWPIALGMMAVALIADCRRSQCMFARPPLLCSTRSIRAGVGALVLIVNILLLLLLVGADVFTVTSGNSLTNSFLAVFACVCLTSVLAQLISRKIGSLAQGMVAGHTEDGKPWEPVEGNALLAEIDNLVIGYNRLVASSNAATKAFSQKSHMLAASGSVYQTAHDIRSPLAALRIVEKEATNLPEDCRELMRGAIGRINSMVESLLNDYRREGAKQSIQDEAEHELYPLVKSVWREKQVCFSAQRLTLTLHCVPSALKCRSEVSAQQLQRSLANLVPNACEACDDGGHVTIRLSCVPSVAVIEIVDDGQGIEPENLAKIMRPGGTIGKENGCGMGLSSAITYFENLGGGLEIVSQPGLGTRVTVRLPTA